MEQVIAELQQSLGNEKVLSNEQLQGRYAHIWKMDVPLKAKALIIPSDSLDVSHAMKICNQWSQTVVIHGGLTGLVDGTLSTNDDIVLSLEKLNKIEEIDIYSRTMTVQSGVILEHLQNEAIKNDLFFPINFGAKGSAQIGGVIATNAGGIRVIRYGMMRDSVLGIEVVLPDGTILSSLNKLIKDNSGYDLKQLFIGSEGTLGIITRAVVKLKEAHHSQNSALVGLKSYSDVLRFLKHMDAGLSGTLSSFELIWLKTYQRMTSHPSLIRPPLPYDYPYYVLLDQLAQNLSGKEGVFEKLLEEALDLNMLADATIAKTVSDNKWFWSLREDIESLLMGFSNVQTFDISLPIPLIGEVTESICQSVNQLNEVNQCYAFGHIADGNIHFIIDKLNDSETLSEEISQIVYLPLAKIGGSISAEHGIGLHKKKYLHLSRSATEIEVMKLLKRTFDPKNILNRGRIFDL